MTGWWSISAALVTMLAVMVLMPESRSGVQLSTAKKSTVWLNRLWPPRDREAERAERLRESSQLLRQLAALLQSGRTETQAWAELHRHWQLSNPDHPLAAVTGQVKAVMQAGAGSAQGLQRCAATQPDADTTALLHRLTTASALSAQSGAPLSRLVEQMARSVEETGRLRAAVQTAVAGPKITQLILSLLPVGGIALGYVMGAAPLQTLLGGAPGLFCLSLGVAALFAGRLWSQRMIAAVLRRTS